jgi:ATP-binding protein involved in chromosome partitioning
MSQPPIAPVLQPALQQVWCSAVQSNVVQAGLVRSAQLASGRATVELVLGFAASSLHAGLAGDVRAALLALPEVSEAHVQVSTHIAEHAVAHGVQRVAGVRNLVAVASGKGGVGKSTTTVNLALALAAEGARVGVLDADIYGPSIPTMLGVHGRPETDDGKTIKPKMGHGLQVSSIGFLVGKDDAMIWRGPMVTQALEQLIRQTQWDNLDYLLVDMPPGTGDIHLTLAQRMPVTAAVVVTTPQEVAILDARKGIRMFEKVSVPVLGLIENMALHTCSQCGHTEPIFGSGGAEALAAELQVPLLGSLPLDIRIRRDADEGAPTVAADPTGEISARYADMARQLSVAVARLGKDMAAKFPKIVVQPT